MSENKALDLFDTFNSNKEAEENGVWLGLHPVTDFKVRAYGAKAVVDLRNRLTKPFAMMIRNGIEIPEEKNEEIGLKVMAEAVIADWKGVKDWRVEVKEGEEAPDLPYSPANAYALCQHLPRLANQLAAASMDASNYKDAKREDDAKN